jgi:hypothetical protein
MKTNLPQLLLVRTSGCDDRGETSPPASLGTLLCSLCRERADNWNHSAGNRTAHAFRRPRRPMLNEEAADILRQLHELEYNERIFVASGYARELREKFASLDHGQYREEASQLLREAIEHAERMLSAVRYLKVWVDGGEE